MAVSERTPRKRALIIGTAILALLIAATVIWVSVASARSSNDTEPEHAVLPEATQMGVVALNVTDLELMRAYYQPAVGLTVLSETPDSVELGHDTPLIVLQHGAGGDALSTPTEAGLYHSAILYQHESDLARVLMNIATVAPQTYQGSADHAVSLAFYFVDPEGNGLELYVDRPTDEWVWQNGEVQMGSAALDPNAFITEHLGDGQGLADSASLGHVHMKVGNLDEAEEFYADVLGFAVTARADGALFYAAGGYHHHLATNVWQSNGAAARSNPTGLASLTVSLPQQGDLDALASRLETAGINYEQSAGEIVVDDPWGNEVRSALRP